jgi:hypothetical protein
MENSTFENCLLHLRCVILTSKTRRDGRIVGVWADGMLLVRLNIDGTLEQCSYNQIEVILPG